jgi:hypothetical protein
LVLGKGSGTVALCGLVIPEHRREGTAGTVREPKGDECVRCLNAAATYRMLSSAQKLEIARLGLWTPILKLLANADHTDNEKEEAIDHCIAQAAMKP